MFTDIVIAQAIYRRFHRHVDDAMLDRCAAECGCAPIGRMCLLDDAATAEIAERCAIRSAARVLDLGCGRGFLGRWLASNGFPAQYAGVDRDAGATQASRRHVPGATITQGDFRAMRWQSSYQAVVGIEIAIDGAIDDPLLDSAASAPAPDGRLVFTIASLDGNHASRLRALDSAAAQRFAKVEIENWTDRVRPFTQRMFEWWLRAAWPPEIEPKVTEEARAVLEALAQNRFHYAVLFARA